MRVEHPSASRRAAFSGTATQLRLTKRHLFYQGQHFRPQRAHMAPNKRRSSARVAALAIPFAVFTLSGVTVASATSSGPPKSVGPPGSPQPFDAPLPGAAATAAPPTVSSGRLSGGSAPSAAQQLVRAAGLSSQLSLAHAELSRPGTVAAFGDAPPPAPKSSSPLVGIALAAGGGYWGLDATGSVHDFDGAPRYGQIPQRSQLGRAVGIVASASGHGYWVFTDRGAVFAFGDARYLGCPPEAEVGSRVTGMAANPMGEGYWLVTSRGKVFGFGDASHVVTAAGHRPAKPVVGIAATPDGKGYWLATANGGVFPYGQAKFLGSASGSHQVMTSIAAARPQQGYWLISEGGHVHAFGAAPQLGSATTAPGTLASALAPTAYGLGYLVASNAAPLPHLDVNLTSLERAGATAEKAASAATAAAVATTTSSTTTTTTVPTTTSAALQFLGDFLVTCYDNYGHTRSGAMAGPQSVAVDPRVIPLGSQIYVDGLGDRTADDTGGAIIGHHIDIWEPTYGDCVDWGVRTRAVYRLGR